MLSNLENLKNGCAWSISYCRKQPCWSRAKSVQIDKIHFLAGIQLAQISSPLVYFEVHLLRWKRGLLSRSWAEPSLQTGAYGVVSVIKRDQVVVKELLRATVLSAFVSSWYVSITTNQANTILQCDKKLWTMGLWEVIISICSRPPGIGWL